MNALIKTEDLGVQVRSDKEFEAAAASGTYLPRLSLMTSNSDKCKSGEFPVNHYALIEGSNHAELPKEVDVLVIDWHPKALDMSNDEQILTSYDTDTELYADIQLRSEGKDSKCMFGPEYLVYVPLLKKYATFFLGSKSARREARSIHAQLQNKATLKSKLVETPKHKWQAPVITPCSAGFEIPPMEDLKAAVKMFRDSEKAPTPEMAPTAEAERAR